MSLWDRRRFQARSGVLLVTGHVVGMRHAAGSVELPRAWVDQFCSRLVDGVPVFPKLSPLQLARVTRRGPYQPRAPVAVADVVLDVLLSDFGVCYPWSL